MHTGSKLPRHRERFLLCILEFLHTPIGPRFQLHINRIGKNLADSVKDFQNPDLKGILGIGLVV